VSKHKESQATISLKKGNEAILKSVKIRIDKNKSEPLAINEFLECRLY
jgi:hypothetical protein